MSIKATCGNCNASFKAKDSLAGKKVKCPKCKSPMLIPNPSTAVVVAGGRGMTTYDPIADLLDEANVKTATRGAGCPECGSEIQPGAVICVDCGLDFETGVQLKTKSGSGGSSEIEDVGLTDADKIMRKAEEEIDETPIEAAGQDFGDGGESFVIALVAGGILAVIIAIALVIIFMMESISDSYNSAFISSIASGGLWLVMTCWLGFVAMKAKPIHGVAVILTGGLYGIFFGFMQGKALIVPTIVLCAAILIGMASFAYVYYNGIYPVESHGVEQFQTIQMACLDYRADVISVLREMKA